MHTAEQIARIVAIALAALTAVMSSGPQLRRHVSNYIAEALAPAIVQLGSEAIIIDPENPAVPASLRPGQTLASR